MEDASSEKINIRSGDILIRDKHTNPHSMSN